MKKYILILIVILQFACNSTKEIPSEDINVTVPYKETVILLGEANREGFSQEPFSNWFNTNFESYEIDQETIDKLKPLLKDVTIKTFMGTWCGDSRRETPNLYKILDAANFNYKNFKLITVSREKSTPKGFEKDMDILYVPTIIFYRNGEEIGRFVEFAQVSLEKDMLAIVSGVGYKHSYED